MSGLKQHSGDCLKASIIPVIQMLDKKVHLGVFARHYGFDHLDNLPYAKLEELRDGLVEEYNASLVEEDRANGETVRLNGEFQSVNREEN